MRDRAAARAGAAMVLSLCVHGLVSLGTPPARAPVAKLPAAVDVWFELASRAAERESRAVPHVVQPEQSPAPAVKKRVRRAPVVQMTKALEAEQAPVSSMARTDVPVADAEPVVVPQLPDLSPGAVARSCEGSRQFSMSDASPQAPTRPERTVADAQATLEQHLFAAANDVPHARRRDPPKLQKRGDGNLWYEGQAFFAVVTPDGNVKFGDIVFADPPPKPQMRDYPPGLAPEYIEVVKRIQALLAPPIPWPDLMDMVARIADDDPYAEEKRWFLRETDDVRRKLADDSRMQETRSTERRVIGELRGIVSNPKLSADARREAVFAVWEMCTGDGEAQWQRVVEAFIRERMPIDSELGYSPELLARLNGKRASLRRFAPYEE